MNIIRGKYFRDIRLFIIIMDFSVEIDKLIRKGIKQGISIDELHSQISDRIQLFERNKLNKKPKKKSVICRPVLYISDSSNDEE